MGKATKPQAITLCLAATAKDQRAGRESLGDLVLGAVATLRDNGYHHCKPSWLAQQATRALCEQIILTGQVSLPVEVNFTGTEGQSPAPSFTLRQGQSQRSI